MVLQRRKVLKLLQKNSHKVIFLVFLLLAVTCNPISLGIISYNVSLGTKVVLWFMATVFLSIALLTILIKKKKALFYSYYTIFLIVLLTVSVAGIFEIYLISQKWREPFEIDHPAFKLSPYYSEVKKQYIHPLYYFSHPYKKKHIESINNKVVSISPDFFRGTTPAERGNKKLAFVIGGSTAFGFGGSSSNEKTFSGFLNQLQDKYHVVNAAVPSWNSTQEFYRISQELIHYKPDLIIVLNGFNDVKINYTFYVTGKDYPRGTPEAFSHIEEWVGDIRSRNANINMKSRLKNIIIPFTIPKTRNFLTYHFDTKIQRKNALSGEYSLEKAELSKGLREDLKNASFHYVRNMEMIKRLCDCYGVKTIFIFQPFFFLHKHIAAKDMALLNYNGNKEYIEYYRLFREMVTPKNAFGVEIHDMSTIYDKYYSEVPLGEIFIIDSCHLYDTGNKILAEETIEIMRKKSLMR